MTGASGETQAPVPGRPCPTCGGEVLAGGRDRPFCSRRCRLVDLGKWFNEEYAVPGEDAFSFDADGLSSEGAGDAHGR